MKASSCEKLTPRSEHIELDYSVWDFEILISEVS